MEVAAVRTRRPCSRIGLTVVVVSSTALPDVRVEDAKVDASGALYSEWGPVFRVDVVQFFEDQPNRLLAHDGAYGSGIWQFDGNPASETRFETDPRAIPFGILGTPPERELIIGSAGGQEILTSLYFGAPHVEAVELNPVTISLLTDHFADFTGHLADRPDVDIHEGDGRSYLARSDGSYDLVWFVAPDSYAATNAASSGAFVLSESYLYTTEMIEETLRHLDDDGIMVVQFGELDFRTTPTRTARYIVTARKALEQLGIEDPSQHLLVAAHLTQNEGDLTTVAVKRTPFTAAEVKGFNDRVAQLPQDEAVYAPGGAATAFADHPVNRLAARRRRGGRRDASPSTRGRSSAVVGRRAVLLALLVVRRRAAPHLRTARRVQSRGRHRRARAAAAARHRRRVRRDLPAAAVRVRAAAVVGAAGQGHLGRVLRRARSRVHVLRDHDDPALDAIPRLSDVLAHRHARVDPRVRPGSARC